MILTISIIGLLLILVIVVYLSYHHIEGFVSTMNTGQLVNSLTPNTPVVFSCSAGSDVTNGIGASAYQIVMNTTVPTPTLNVSPAATGAVPTVTVSDCSMLKNTIQSAAASAGPAAASAPAPAAAAAAAPAAPAAASAPASAPAAPAAPVVPAAPADLSSGSSIVPPMGAGPAPYGAMNGTTPSHGAIPSRTDVVPQVSMSPTGQAASMLQQKSDLLKDIQKIFRNELLASRSTDASTMNTSSCAGSPSMSQGEEYNSKMIKKDSIPCWGCSLDY